MRLTLPAYLVVADNTIDVVCEVEIALGRGKTEVKSLHINGSQIELEDQDLDSLTDEIDTLQEYAE